MTHPISEPVGFVLSLGCSLFALGAVWWTPIRQLLAGLVGDETALGPGLLAIGGVYVFAAAAVVLGTEASVGDQSSVFATLGRLGVASYWAGLHLAAIPVAETFDRTEFRVTENGTLSRLEVIDDRLQAWGVLLSSRYPRVQWGIVGCPLVATLAPVTGVSLGIAGGLLLYGICVALSVLYR